MRHTLIKRVRCIKVHDKESKKITEGKEGCNSFSAELARLLMFVSENVFKDNEP